MALVVCDGGESLALQYLVNKAAPQNLVLRLFQNNITPAETDVVGTYTEATFTGYVAITLTGASWTISGTAAWSFQAGGGPLDYSYDGSGGLVLGGEAVLVFESGAAPAASGGGHKVRFLGRRQPLKPPDRKQPKEQPKRLVFEWIGSGGLVFGGSAAWEFEAGPVPEPEAEPEVVAVAEVVEPVELLAYGWSGSARFGFSGKAAREFEAARFGSGGFRLAGSADWSTEANPPAIAKLALSGVAAWQFEAGSRPAVLEPQPVDMSEEEMVVLFLLP